MIAQLETPAVATSRPPWTGYLNVTSRLLSDRLKG
jgi:hypothetical protein